MKETAQIQPAKKQLKPSVGCFSALVLLEYTPLPHLVSGRCFISFTRVFSSYFVYLVLLLGLLCQKSFHSALVGLHLDAACSFGSPHARQTLISEETFSRREPRWWPLGPGGEATETGLFSLEKGQYQGVPAAAPTSTHREASRR